MIYYPNCKIYNPNLQALSATKQNQYNNMSTNILSITIEVCTNYLKTNTFFKRKT